MKKLFSLVAILCLFGYSGYAQHSLNDYKYVIVEKQFHFQTEPNQYDLNRMAKFQFEKNGFIVIVEGQKLPEDLKSNYCLALTSEITAKGLLRTKGKITLRNCHSEVVYVSGDGITKEKDLARAFDLAIRKAFDTMKSLNYRYVPNEAITSVGKSTKDVKIAEDKIEKLEAEIEELKKEKEVERVEETEEKVMDIVKEEKEEEKVVEMIEEEVVAEQYYQAIKTNNGFDIRDNMTQKVLFKVYKTSIKNVFLIEGKAGILLRKGKSWGREYVDGGKTVFEPLDIRF